MRRGTAFLSITTMALVGLGGCGHQPAETSAKPAASAAPDGPYGRSHQQEAVALAARTAAGVMPGRLDFAHPLATYTTLNLPPSGGSSEEGVPGWIIAFPIKPSAMAAATPSAEIGSSTPPPPGPGPLSGFPPGPGSGRGPGAGPAPIGGVPPTSITLPGAGAPNGTQPPPPIGADVRMAPSGPKPPAAMGSAPPPRPPGASGASPSKPGTAPMPASGPGPTSPIGCTVYVTIDGRSQLTGPQH